MSDFQVGASQFVGEIRMFGGSFAPQGWFMCDGSLQPISEYDALFNLIGTTYGGDGQSTFALPDMRSRVPVHQGTYQGMTYILGEPGGVENVTLTSAQMASHSHPFAGAPEVAASNIASNAVPASVPSSLSAYPYGLRAPYRAIDPGIVEPNGGSEAHMNIQPYLCFVFIIAWDGVYPQPGQVVDGALDV